MSDRDSVLAEYERTIATRLTEEERRRRATLSGQAQRIALSLLRKRHRDEYRDLYQAALRELDGQRGTR